MTAARPQRRQVEVAAVIALGSNLGDREATIRAAADELGATAGIRLIALSPLFTTPALKLSGIDYDAPAYLNAVALVRTVLTPRQLLEVAHGIENAHGRVRAERWGDRTLDVDLIDVAGRVMHDEVLTLPHPRAAERAFVLAPWHALDPDAQLVGHGAVADLLARASDPVELYREPRG